MKKIVVLFCIITMFLFTACAKKETVTDKGGDISKVTELNCHVESFQCGYISYADVLGNGLLFITTEEKLAEAMNYEVFMVSDEWYANNAIALAFQKMQETYPVGEYAYLIEYRETTSGGYEIHANSVGMTDDKIGFLLDKNVQPTEGQMVTEEMGGFCHMAAIPKSQTEGKTFVNVVEP